MFLNVLVEHKIFPCSGNPEPILYSSGWSCFTPHHSLQFFIPANTEFCLPFYNLVFCYVRSVAVLSVSLHLYCCEQLGISRVLFLHTILPSSSTLLSSCVLQNSCGTLIATYFHRETECLMPSFLSHPLTTYVFGDQMSGVIWSCLSSHTRILQQCWWIYEAIVQMPCGLFPSTW